MNPDHRPQLWLSVAAMVALGMATMTLHEPRVHRGQPWSTLRHSAPAAYREPVEAAFALLPGWLAHELADTPFLLGVAEPGWDTHLVTVDGRAYSHTAHVSFAHNQALRPVGERETTVVLPQPVSVTTVVHELGHVLHERLGFPNAPEPVTAYAQTNELEAFAEAFTAVFVPGYLGDGPEWAYSWANLERYRLQYPELAAYFWSER